MTVQEAFRGAAMAALTARLRGSLELANEGSAAELDRLFAEQATLAQREQEVSAGKAALQVCALGTILLLKGSAIVGPSVSGKWLLCVAVLRVIVQVARYESLVVMEAKRGKADSGRDALHVLAQDMVFVSISLRSEGCCTC